MSGSKGLHHPPQASEPILPPHIHEAVDFRNELKEAGHSIAALTDELNWTLNLKNDAGGRFLTDKQKSYLLDYQLKQNLFKRLRDPDWTAENKGHLFAGLFNTLIFRDKLKGRLGMKFSGKINEENEEKCSKTTVDRGYASIVVWSQAFITRPERRLRQLQQIVLVEMLNAFFMIYGCTRCWMDHPDWQEQERYGKSDLYRTIRAATEDKAYLNLGMFT